MEEGDGLSGGEPGSSASVVVIGGGAAGLMAAIFAARRRRDAPAPVGGPGGPVVLLEATRDGGRKILVSGGGRCNILPGVPGEETLAEAAARFVTDSSPHTLRKMLLAWPLAEQRRFFEQDAGVALRLEAETGKLFPASNRARDVRDALVALARREGVEIRLGARVTGLRPTAGPGPSEPTSEPAAGWRVELAADEEALVARSVVLATGGLSMPGTGSDGAGLSIAAHLGLTIHATYPALVPLLADPPRHEHLAGLSLPVSITARAAGRAQRAHGGFLFTHRGYSGPSVLDVSHVAARALRAGVPPSDVDVRVAWTATESSTWDRLLGDDSTRSGLVASRLRDRLTGRLADMVLAEARIPADRALSRLEREERRRLVEALVGQRLPVTGDEGYAKAEVTGGGVSLAEVEPRTLEAKRLPGLFLCGEILDAFGPIGGYNFAWAWATGRAAGWAAAG